MKIDEAINNFTNAKKRKFVQSYDLIINLKNIDLKKPENKFSKDIVLPHGRGKDIDVGIISDKISGAINKKELESLDKHKIKELMEKYEFFVCEAPLMPLVGKVLGRYLAPKGRMPKILPPGTNHEKMSEELEKSVRVNVRDSPTIHVIIGTENMKPESVKENAERVINEVKKSLPGKVHIKNVLLKLTMSKPVKIDVI